MTLRRYGPTTRSFFLVSNFVAQFRCSFAQAYAAFFACTNTTMTNSHMSELGPFLSRSSGNQERCCKSLVTSSRALGCQSLSWCGAECVVFGFSGDRRLDFESVLSLIKSFPSLDSFDFAGTNFVASAVWEKQPVFRVELVANPDWRRRW